MFSILLLTRPSRAQWLGLLFSLLIGTWLLPTPAYADLPPRPAAPAKEKEEPVRPQVAPLILSTNPNASGLWSVVQWQDSQGGWQDVASWRGAVVNGRTIWWVEAKDFGKGPFRWVITQGEGGAVVATSASFHLPSQAQQPLTIDLALP